MPRRGSTLTKAEELALQAEAARIAELNGAWVPTEEALREVVEAIKRAGDIEYRKAQERGIAAARERGVHMGRPRKERPASYLALAKAVKEGRTTRAAAAYELGVSGETLRKWMLSDARREALLSEAEHPPARASE